MDHLEPKQVPDFPQKNPDALFIDCRCGNRSLDAGPASQSLIGWMYDTFFSDDLGVPRIRVSRPINPV